VFWPRSKPEQISTSLLLKIVADLLDLTFKMYITLEKLGGEPTAYSVKNQ